MTKAEAAVRRTARSRSIAAPRPWMRPWVPLMAAVAALALLGVGPYAIADSDGEPSMPRGIPGYGPRVDRTLSTRTVSPSPVHVVGGGTGSSSSAAGAATSGGSILAPRRGQLLLPGFEATGRVHRLATGHQLWLVTFDPAARRYHPGSRSLPIDAAGTWKAQLRLGTWCVSGDPVRVLLVATDARASAALNDLGTHPVPTAGAGLAKLPRGSAVIDSVSARRA